MNAFMPEQLNLKRAKKDDKKQLRKLAFLKRSKGNTLLHEIPGPRPGALWGGAHKIRLPWVDAD